SSSSRHRHNSTGASSSSHRFSSKGNKNGLCWANGPYVDVGKFKKSMSWLYSWSASMPLKDGKWWLPDDIQYFPMLWGKERKRIAEWKKHVLNDRHARQNKAKVAMGPNEVNQVGQGKMTPAEACDLYRKYIIPLKDEDGWYLIGPSTTSAPDGKKWTKEFKKSCPDVYRKIDADAVHYYGTNPDTAIKYIKDWHQTFGKDIWITEIGCMNFDGSGPPTLGQAYDFLKRTSNFADDADYVKGYAYYAVLEKLNINPVNRLSTVTGNPTDLFK
ncbi:glycoside hydrolase family 128 protein, partial [Tilletiaria anomala UBC 951]